MCIVVSALVDYGRGRHTILPLSIQCGDRIDTFSECSTTEFDVNHCIHVAGVDCKGIVVWNIRRI